MQLLGILLVLSGGFLDYGAITGRSPLAMLQSMVGGKPLPPRNSWNPLVVQKAQATAIEESGLADPTAQEGQAEHGSASSDIGSGSKQNVSSARQAVVAYAQDQEGKPYVWDTAGPKTFDCSGLTMKAYQAVGINLPHLAAGQMKYGKSVSLAQARPGDLVFWSHTKGGPAFHVAIYVGGDDVIAAPHTGTVVKKEKLYDLNEISIRSILP